MKTLFIASHLSVGGAESILLKQKDILYPDIRFVCTDNYGLAANRLIEEKIDVVDLSKTKDKQQSISNEIIEYNPDLIILSNATCYKALELTQYMKHKTITQIHGDISSPSSFSSKFVDLHINVLDGIICSHAKTSDILKTRHKVKQIIIPNPIDSSFFDTVRKHTRHTVGFCGRISPEKRLISMAKILGRTKASIPDINALIVGDADSSYRKCEDYKACVIAAFANVNVPVRITGFVNDCARYMSAMQLGLLLSECEGFANFPFEAYAMNIPMLATDVGAMYSIMNSTDLVTVKDPREFDDSMTSLFSDIIVKKLEDNSDENLKQKVYHAHVENYKTAFSNFLRGL